MYRSIRRPTVERPLLAVCKMREHQEENLTEVTCGGVPKQVFEARVQADQLRVLRHEPVKAWGNSLVEGICAQSGAELRPISVGNA